MEKEKDIFDYIKAKKVDLPSVDYFKNLAATVIEKQRPKIIPMYKRPTTWFGAVAAVLIVVLLVTNISESSEITQGSTDPLLALNDLSSDDLISYIDNNIDDFDTDMIAEMIPENLLEDIELFDEVDIQVDDAISVNKSTLNAPTIEINELNDQDILDYFNDEGFDLEDFEDENPFI